MKKFYSLVIVLCSLSSYCQAQYVDIFDPLFKSKLIALYPGCFNGIGQMDTTCTAITTEDTLDISAPIADGFQIMSISGIEFFDNLRNLNCSGNSLSNIFKLPPLLETLDCSSQIYGGFINWFQLATLPPLPSTLRRLDIHNNGFSSLPALNAGLTWLDCSSNHYHSSQGGVIPELDTLVGLPSSLLYLNCSGNRLTNLPSLPPALEYLDAGYNKFYYDATPLGIFSFPGITLVPSLPSSLTDLILSHNNVGQLPSLPTSLAFLSVFDNPITCLPILPSSMGGQSPYNTLPFNLYTALSNINCLANAVPGIREATPLPVCNPGNNTNGCLMITAPIIIAEPAINGLSTLAGTPSSPGTYTLSANYLLPASGNITIEPSAFLEVSLDNVNYFSSALPVPYTAGTVASTTIFVRISAAAPAGSFFGTVFNSGGGAPTDTIIVNGNVLPVIPFIYAAPDITGLTGSGGGPSPAETYSLSAENLTPASGNITITPSASLEVSTDNIIFSSSPITVPYVAGQLDSTTIFVRIAAGTPPGLISGTITNSGGGAVSAIVTVSGTMARQYYNTKANLGLNNPGTWSTTIDGTGPSPVSLTAGYQDLIIISQANANYSGVWDMSAPGSKITVGNAVLPITLTIPAGADSVTSQSRIDVMNNSVLRILNNRLPILNNLEAGSTVDFAQTGMVSPGDMIIIPANNYGYLKLTKGLKYLDSGTTTVKNNFIADSVVSLNGSASASVSILNCFGDATFNGTTFDASTDSRFALKMNGPGPQQYINAPGTTLHLLSIERDSASTSTITLSQYGFLFLGGNKGGGLYMRPANSTFKNIGSWIHLVNAGSISLDAALGKLDCFYTSFVISKNAVGNYPVLTNSAGILRFIPGSSINSLSMGIQSIGSPNDQIIIDNSIDILETLGLTSGKVVMSPGAILNVTSSALLSGNNNSYVDGPLKAVGFGSIFFPVGNGNRYAPVLVNNFTTNNTFTIRYRKAGYGNYLIDPATLALYPGYDVSEYEYWDVNSVEPGTATLNFYYTDSTSGNFPAGVRMARFDGSDWNDVPSGIGLNSSSTSGSLVVDNLSEYGPYTFSSAVGGIIPVKLASFAVKKQNSSVLINWTTEQEINSKEFIVERSIDGSKWDEITRMNAAGNSSQKINYSVTDYVPFKGMNYYRLKQIDLDNRIVYSEIRSVYFGADVNIVLAPNPARDNVTVYIPGNSVSATIHIFNLKAQLVKLTSTSEESVQINISNLPRGIYSIKITGKNINQVKKLVID